MNIQNHAEQKQDFPEISHLIIACGYRFWSALTLAILSAGLFATIATLLVPIQHMASGHVRVRQREGYLLTTQQTRSEDVAFVRAQESLVLQEQTLERALLISELQTLVSAFSPSERIEWIKGQIKADISAGSEVMTITASNPSPETAIQVARSVTQAYVNAVTEQLSSSRSRRIQELEAAAKDADAILKSHWMELQIKAGKIGSGNPQALAMNEQVRIQSYRDTSSRLRSLQLQRTQLESLVQDELTKQTPVQTVSDSQVSAMVDINPEITSRREGLRKIELQIRELESVAVSNENPRLVRLRNQRDYDLQDLRAFEKRVENTIRDQQQEKLISAPVANVSGLQNQIALIEQEEKFLSESLLQLEGAIEESGGKNGIELEMLRHEIEREEKLADSLWKTLEELRIEERAEPRIALIDLPATAERTSRSKQTKAAATAGFFGIVIALLAVGYIEWRSCRIHSAADVVEHAQMEVFGATNLQRSMSLLNWLRPKKHNSVIDGSSEIAALLLLQAGPNGSLPSLMVTSATHAEGRDVPAVNIATAIAGASRRVLLVNCDSDSTLPASSLVETRPNSDQSVGLSENYWRASVRHEANFGFDYLSLGGNRNSLARIATQLLPRILEEANEFYEAIVVLGPPVLSFAESVLIATRCDRTVLTTVPDQTPWNHLVAARHRLEFSKASSMGAVFQVAGHRPVRLTLVDVALGKDAGDFDSMQGDQDTVQETLSSSPTTAEEESIHSQVMDLKNHLARRDFVASEIAPPHVHAIAKPSMTRLHRKPVE